MPYGDRLSARAGYWDAQTMKAMRRADRWRKATIPLMVSAAVLSGLEWEWCTACGLACMLAAGLCAIPSYVEDRRRDTALKRRDWLLGKEKA